MTNLIILKDELGLALTGNDLTLELKAALVVGGGGSWGSITGTLSNQTDLQSALNAKADASSLQAHENDTSNPHGVTAAQSGADPSGTASGLMTAHTSASDPHPQYLQSSDVGSAAFTASTDYATAAQGSTADTALQPNDGLSALDSAAASKLSGIEPGAEVNVQSDWSAVSGDAYIQNKPTLGSLAAKSAVDIADINATGTPSSSNYLRGDGAWATDIAAVWGSVTGTLSDQTDLQNALDAKASTSSLSAHTSDTNNPHGTTKTHVGLSNVDNTADASKNVLSATKLTTARNIGGVSFDGTADINLPGVNTAGNQNTTGTASNVTGTVAISNGGTGATDAATARSNLGAGDVTGPASSTNNNVALFDGATGKLLKDGGTLGTAAFTDSSAYATAAQGTTADNALPKSGGTMTGNITFDGGQTWPTFNQNTTGSAAKWTTGRTFTIGSTGKSVDGSADVSWSLAEIGAGDMFGPSSATDGNVVIFDGATGKLTKNKADTITLDADTGKTTEAYLGSELLTNGDFSGGSTGWTLGTGWSFSGTPIYDATTSSPGTLSQTISVILGQAYYIEWTAQSSSELNASMSAQIGAVASGTTLYPQSMSAKTYSVVLVASSSGSMNFLLKPTKQRGTGTVTITNVSVKQIYCSTIDFKFKSSNGWFDVTQRGTNTFFGGGGLCNYIGAGNFSLGFNALYCNYSGTDNIAVGKEALYSNSIGIGNLAFGYQILYKNTQGEYNVGLGYGVLQNNTCGDNNIGIGYKALSNNILGGGNIALGSQALSSNTVAINNIAIGTRAMQYATVGGGNIGIGLEALKNLTSGEANVAVGGSGALLSITTGSNNSGIGHFALRNNTAGSNNGAFGRQAGMYYGSGSDALSNTTKGVYLGYNCRASANSASNQIVIGADAIGAGDNTVRLGDSNITLVSTDGQLLSTRTYSNTSASAANVFIDTDGKMYRSTSSEQYKTAIEPIDTSIANKLILESNPVYFKSTASRDVGKSFYGLIAEEVAALDPRMVQWGYPTKRITVLEAREATEDVYDDEGNLVESGQPAVEAQYADVPDYDAAPIPEGVNYTAMIAPLIDLVKRQHATIESLTSRVTALENGSGGKVLQ